MTRGRCQSPPPQPTQKLRPPAKPLHQRHGVGAVRQCRVWGPNKTPQSPTGATSTRRAEVAPRRRREPDDRNRQRPRHHRRGKRPQVRPPKKRSRPHQKPHPPATPRRPGHGRGVKGARNPGKTHLTHVFPRVKTIAEMPDRLVDTTRSPSYIGGIGPRCHIETQMSVRRGTTRSAYRRGENQHCETPSPDSPSRE